MTTLSGEGLFVRTAYDEDAAALIDLWSSPENRGETNVESVDALQFSLDVNVLTAVAFDHTGALVGCISLDVAPVHTREVAERAAWPKLLKSKLH